MPTDFSFRSYFDGLLTEPNLTRLLITAAVLVAILLLRWLVLRAVRKRVERLDTRVLWRQATNYVALVVLLVAVVQVWFQGVGAALTILSLVAAALTIIHKEFIMNLSAWSVITWRSLFGIGDRIQIGTFTGDVVHLGIMYFTLAQVGEGAQADAHTGKLVKVPNGLVTTLPVVNYSRTVNYIWHQLSLKLKPEADRPAAKALARDVLQKTIDPVPEEAIAATVGRAESLMYPTTEPQVYITVFEGNMNLVLRYLCHPRQRVSTEQALWAALLDALDDQEAVMIALDT